MVSKRSTFSIRQAKMDDVPALNNLIFESIRALGRQHYTHQQIESGLQYLFHLDTHLIEDGTYYVMETDDGVIVGSGGWSCRGNLYGAGAIPVQLSDSSNPAMNTAVIRTLFVHPNWARRGVATRLLRTSEMVARRAGFHQLELLATLVGLPLYLKFGYQPVENIQIALPDDHVFPAVKMVKALSTTYPSGR